MAAPTVEGLADFVVDGYHLIRGDRMSLWGENLATATSLTVGGMSCSILSPEAGTYFGGDRFSFDVPTTITPRADGTVQVVVTNPDGTWSSDDPDVTTFGVAQPGPWIQPDDVVTTLDVGAGLIAGITGTSEYDSAVTGSFDDGGTGAIAATHSLDPADWSIGAGNRGDMSTTSARGAEMVDRVYTAGVTAGAYYGLYDHYWQRPDHIPTSGETPAGALGYEIEGQNTQDWAATGTLHYPATVTVSLTEVGVDPTGELVGTIEIRDLPTAYITSLDTSGSSPAAATGTPPDYSDIASAALRTSDDGTLLASTDPPRTFTFTVDETDFTPSTLAEGNEYTFGVFLGRWVAQDWTGFPPIGTTGPPDGGVDHVWFVGAATQAAAPFTPRRYRFVYPLVGTVEVWAHVEGAVTTGTEIWG